MASVRSRATAFMALCIIGAIVCTAVMVVVSPLEFGRRPWNAFDVVLVPAETEQDAAARLLASGESVLYLQNAGILIENFDGGETVELSRLDERLDPEDPRVDPFVSAIDQVFRTERDGANYAVLFLDRRASLTERWFMLQEAIPSGNFILAGWQPVVPVAGATVALVALLPLVVAVRVRRLLSAVIALTAAAAALLFGPALLAPAVMCAAGLIYLQSESLWIERAAFTGRSLRLERRHVPPVMFVVLSIVVPFVAFAALAERGSVSLEVAGMVLYLGAQGFTLAAGVVGHFIRIGHRDHPLFIPRSILRRRSRVVPAVVVPAAVLVAGYGVLLFAADGEVSGGRARVPAPVAVDRPAAAENVSQSRIDALRTISPVEHPVSTAGYLAHRWYQTSLLYGGSFNVPELGETITLQRLRRDGPGLRAFYEEVRRFDEAWITQQLSQAPTDLYRLFTDEPGVFRIDAQPIGAPGVERVHLVIALAVMCVPIAPLPAAARLPYRGLLGTVSAASRSKRPQS